MYANNLFLQINLKVDSFMRTMHEQLYNCTVHTVYTSETILHKAKMFLVYIF